VARAAAAATRAAAYLATAIGMVARLERQQRLVSTFN